ncbi:right-handed parallel beta-helix repeat-containing protein [Acidobacteria bacterium AB60]|nr:right-handed parallel beta-helix repeat-containing protein [Acidobacteria bacterium AB60]
MLPRLRPVLISAPLLLSLASPAFGQFRPTLNVNCTRGDSLASAVSFAFPNTLINVKGTCAGPINITTDGLQLNAVGAASINGGGKNAVTVTGAHKVTLTGLAISAGAVGVVAQNGAQVTLQNDTVSGNSGSGILALGTSSLTVSGGSAQGNAVHGIDVEASSALVVSGSYAVTGNGVFGINVNNGSSITLTGATLSVTQNTLGIQLGTNASGFLDGASTLTASQNFSDGITIVSGSHVVDFGGTIQTLYNAIHGISLNSKAGLDLDAGSQVTSNYNGADGVHLEQSSELTVFNNPNFSGNPRTTLLTVTNNTNDGIAVLTGSQVLDDNYAAITAQANTLFGIAVDNGSSVTFGQTIPVSGVQSIVNGNTVDVILTFGSRMDTGANLSVGTLECDRTVILRGATGFTCPR